MNFSFSNNESPAPSSFQSAASGHEKEKDGKEGYVEEGDAEYDSSQVATLWRHRSLWMVPLGSEAVLLAVAANLALAFAWVMQGNTHVYDWGWVLGLGAVFILARLYVSWRELFLPRTVAFFAVCLLGGGAIGLLAGLLVAEPWHAAFTGLSLQYRLLVGLPLVLFLARMAGVLRAARFSPALNDLDRWYKAGGRSLSQALRTRLEFWMR